MQQVVLNSERQAKLDELTEQAEFRDEAGNVVGYYLPAEHYKWLLRSIPIPYSDEELERRFNEPGGSSLEEFWRKMGQ